MNTRQYPRSLNEAFPKTANYACSVERRHPTDYPLLWWVLVGLCAVVAVLDYWSTR